MKKDLTIREQLSYLAMPDKDLIEYLGEDNLPNDLSVWKTKQTLTLLESKKIKPTAIRCSGMGGGVIIFMNDDDQGHIEWTNDGEVDFFNIEKFVDKDILDQIKVFEDRRYSLSDKPDHPEYIKVIDRYSCWDGMLSGTIKYQNKKYWAKCVVDEHHYRIFGIYNLEDKEQLKSPIGYYDNNEFKFRKTIHRSYFVHKERRQKLHTCSNEDYIEWRNDCTKLHYGGGNEEEYVFGEVYEGWAMRVNEKSDHFDSSYWLAIDFCPWCAVKLPREYDPEVYKENE